LLLPQLALTGVTAGTATAVGTAILVVLVLVQPLASFTVTVYVPLTSPLAVTDVAVLLQVYVNVPVPPLAAATALPVPAAQSGLVGVTELIAGPLVLFMDTVLVFVHPLASVTSTVYNAAKRLPAVCPEALVLHVYVNAPVPPLALATALPLLFPHVALTGVIVTGLIAGGIVIAAVLVFEHAFASVTVTV